MKKTSLPSLLPLLSCLAAVFLAVAVNVLVSRLPNSLLRLDTTQIGLHSLSEETRTYLKTLESDVSLYLIAQQGAESVTTMNLLRNLEDGSPHITFTLLDPALYPDFLPEFTGESRVSDNSILVVSPLRSKWIDVSEYDSSTYYMGEDYVLGGIRYVLADTLPVICQITGHGEQPLSQAITSTLELNGYRTETVSLHGGQTVPPDARMLLLLSPKTDLTAEEAERLLAYLQEGGRLCLVTAPGTDDLENLMYVMDHYGTYAQTGYLCEGSSGSHVTGLPSYLLPTPNVNTETRELLTGIRSPILPLAHGICEKETYRESLKIYRFLQTSDEAYARPLSAPETDRQPGDPDGPFSVGVAVTEAPDGEHTTRILWISSAIFLDGEVDEASGGENGRLLLNGVNWLTHEELLTLHAKQVSTQALKIKASESKFWGGILVGAVPLSCLAVGTAVWLRRKRR